MTVPEPEQPTPDPAAAGLLPLAERVDAYLTAHRVLQERLGLTGS